MDVTPPDGFRARALVRLLGPGRPIPDASRDLLAPAFPDVDLAHVRLHDAPWDSSLRRLLLGAGKAAAVTLGRRIVARPGVLEGDSAEPLALLAHELVHVAQYGRQGNARFLVSYLGEYFRGRLRGRGHAGAYRAISYEVVAFTVGKAVALAVESGGDAAAAAIAFGAQERV